MSDQIAADPWLILGMDPSTDRGAIRKAYARRLKVIDPEVDPAAFIELRHARDWAMARAEAAGGQPGPAPEAAEDAFGHSSPTDPAPIASEAAAQVTHGPDREAIAALHAMVLDPASAATAADVEAQTERVLSDPALANIDEAGRMEEFIGTLIVQGTPRSDAMLDPAIRHFRWDADRPELERQPIVGWVAQRQADIDFENALPYRNAVYARLVRDLRISGLPRRPRWTAWRFGTRVEYLLAHLRQLHPTVLAGADRSKLDWWSSRIAEQKEAAMPVRWLREGWRRSVWTRGLDRPIDWRSLYFYVAIAVAPYLFVWFLLRRGHSSTERRIGFGYLAAYLLVVGATQAPHTAFKSTPVSPVVAPVAPHPYRDFAADLETVLDGETAGTVDPAALRSRNPALWRVLHDRWQVAARESIAFPTYQDQAASVLDTVLGAALKTGDAKLLTDFANAYNARLRWAERGGPEACVDVLAGISGGPDASDFADYRRRLVGRAILAGTSPPVQPMSKRGRRLFTIPPEIFAEAQRRSLLDSPSFRQALRGMGTALARCNAHIALIDAAVVSGNSAGSSVLRGFFAVE